MNGKSPSDKPESGQAARPAHELGNYLRPAATIQPSMTVPNVTAPPAPKPQQPPQPRPIPAVAIPPEAGETAEELFGRLRRMNAEGKATLDLDLRRLMHIDSPVAFEAESNQWVYGLLIVTAVVWYVLGYKIGLGAAAASVLFYLTIAKAFLRRRIERRVREQVLEDLARWRKLWTFGGVTIREIAEGREGAICEAPRDNWMDFVRRCSR
jgi:hypothetical protein